MTASVESTTLATSRQTQPKVQHMVTTFMGNKSKVLQQLSKSLTTLDIFTVNGTLPPTDLVLILPRGGYHLLLLWGRLVMYLMVVLTPHLPLPAPPQWQPGY